MSDTEASGPQRPWRGGRVSGGHPSRAVIVFTCVTLYVLLRLLNPLAIERLRDSAIVEVMDLVTWTGESGAETARRGATGPVVVLDIDEATVASFGRWPLPHTALAQIVDAVQVKGAAAIGFAYVFTHASVRDAADQQLAASMARSRVILGTTESRGAGNGAKVNLRVVPVHFDRLAALEALPEFGQLIRIPDPLMSAAAGTGLLGLQLSHSGVPIRLPTLVRHKDGVVPSLPLDMMRLGAGAGLISVTSGLSGLHEVRVGRRVIETGPDGMLWFRAAPKGDIHRVSALDVLSGDEKTGLFPGAYVVIGSTAAGVSSELVAADGTLLPGLDALGYALASLLTGDTYFYPALSLLLEMLIAVMLAAIVFFADWRFNAPVFLGIGVAAFGALWAGAVVIAGGGRIVDPGLLSALLVALLATLMLNRYRLTRKEAGTVIAEKEKEVTTLREDSARVAIAAANPRLSIALSHELRQPLAAATNYLGAIRRLAGRTQPEGSGNLATYADEASRQISSMTEIMNELAEIVRGDLTLQTEDDIGAVLREAVASALPQGGESGVQFMDEIPGDAPPVRINRRQIQLVVSNLARNAVEAPRNREELILRLRLRPVNAEYVEVSVSDNAAGIPESARHRLFSRFESSKQKGSGVGLPLCRDIVQAHGGRIWFETATGRGTTFFFTLRRADQRNPDRLS